MKNGHVYKTVELTGTSSSTLEAAVNNAIRTASTTLRHLRWFEVVEIRGDIESGEIIHWQVTLKAGFRLEASEEADPDRRLAVFGKGNLKLHTSASGKREASGRARRPRR